jgi:hypothetical protein
VSCCVEELLPKHHADAGRISLFKDISTLQLSPALLRELRMALLRREKPVVAAGSRSTASTGGAITSQHS